MSLQRRGSTTAGGHGSATKAPKPGKAGAPVSADVTEVLTALAANCEDSYPLQAIHCLMALLQHGRLPKAQEARVRLALARLMLQHTTNAAAAHKELLAARAIAKDLLGAVSLQCEIACQLAHYYQSQGEAAYQAQMYDQALELCLVGTAASEGPILHRWIPLLHLLKAQALASDADTTRAVHALQAAAAYCDAHAAQHAPLLLDVAVHTQLFKMQLCMLAEDADGVGNADKEAARLIAMLPQAARDGAAAAASTAFVIPAGSYAASALQLKLLQALNLISSGRIDTLLSWGSSAQVSPPQAGKPPQGDPAAELRKLASDAAGHMTGFKWLSDAAISALICLISAHISMYRSKLKVAIEQSEQGVITLQPTLEDMGLDLEATSERTLDAVSLLECCAPLAVHLHLLLVKAGALMAQGDTEDAQPVLQEAISMATRFPNRLRLMLFPLHILLAQYCYATQEWTAAKLHLQAVKLNCAANSRTHLLASALLAVTTLAEAGPQSVSNSSAVVESAIEALGAAQYTSHQEAQQAETSNTLETTIAQLSVCLIKLRLEQTQDARLLLSRTLQVAHQRLNHYALVAQIMALMVPLQVGNGDNAGAQSLAQSSAMLSRSQPAVQAHVYGVWSALSEQLHGKDHKDTNRTRAVSNDHAKKVSQHVTAAKAQEDHQQLLTWGLKTA